MIEISKRTVIFLVIAALLLGSLGTVYVLKIGSSGGVLVSKEEYSELTRFEEEYGKFDKIKRFLEDNYYIEVDENKLMESAYYGLVDGLEDKYSGYISANDYSAYLESLFGTETY